MKGYELYSWSEDSQWHFTIITGTNRNKTLEEITSQGDYISESGWVKGHFVSVDAIKDVLSRPTILIPVDDLGPYEELKLEIEIISLV